VLVVGAGAAGLTAAARLAEAGCRVVVLEARDRLGGRIWSHDPWRTGRPIDLGAEFIHDSPLARRLTPALTTVRQDVAAKGTAAAAELVAAVRARRAGGEARARRHLLATELVLRDTTAPPVEAVHGTNGTFVG